MNNRLQSYVICNLKIPLNLFIQAYLFIRQVRVGKETHVRIARHDLQSKMLILISIDLESAVAMQ